MGVTAEQYLRELDAGRRPDLPETTAGTVRLDVRGDGCTDHWYLTIADQHVRVARSADDAELVIRAERWVFDRMVNGELHPGAALLRNELAVQGNMRLLMLLRRLFARPAGARHPRELGRAATAARASDRSAADVQASERSAAGVQASERSAVRAREERP
ncbi:SCP2 sterol-binding domain-containing protein [Micromonospora tarensis]|uniref:SCP2 sterol-binding domain-containing protein n=1 Tax=Micromonospora tarensis TaxID=2806100 RepID=A0ABS1YH23_9ACTN|nr:SCP2 sterol-binding domain-containing protein [Micromonospora tarensis]MBM0276698.1 SCP2 sterol-binding domain-containing protein [Micromonospora tarensis]